jgi:hypothetical protein
MEGLGSLFFASACCMRCKEQKSDHTFSKKTLNGKLDLKAGVR